MLFEMLHIPLYHCWVVNPKDIDIFKLTKNLSYNQLVDKIVSSSSSNPDSSEFIEGLVLKSFIEETATQMTLYGIECLRRAVCEDSYCVLFHNNHFSTITKHNNCLYTLVSSSAFELEPDVVWESLDNTDGCGNLYDGNFKPFVHHDTISSVQTRSSPKSVSNLEGGGSSISPVHQYNGKSEQIVNSKKKNPNDNCPLL